MCGKTRRKLPQIRTILLSEGLPDGNLLEDNSLMRLPLLRFGLFVLSRVCLRAYKNINGDEIRKIKCNYLLLGFISHVSLEMLLMLRLIREPQMGQNRWEFCVRLQGCHYQRQRNVFNFVASQKTGKSCNMICLLAIYNTSMPVAWSNFWKAVVFTWFFCVYEKRKTKTKGIFFPTYKQTTEKKGQQKWWNEAFLLHQKMSSASARTVK